MPHARDRLDVIVVPAEPLWEVAAPPVQDLFDRWQDAGMLAPGTGGLRRTAGPRAWALMAGGFGTIWLDRPTQVTLYANQQGGFRVSCPACGAPMARPFGQAVQNWRAGGPPLVRCGACAAEHAVTEVPLNPPGAFARGAVVFGDAEGLEPAAHALKELREVLGGVRVVLRRRS